MISSEGDSIPWAAAGQTVTLYMTSVDPIHLNVGSILCPPTAVVPLATVFTARIIVFDITMPITAGTSVRPNLPKKSNRTPPKWYRLSILLSLSLFLTSRFLVKPDATAEEVKAVVDDDQGGQIFSQALMSSTTYGQSRAAYREVQERHEDIKRI